MSNRGVLTRATRSSRSVPGRMRFRALGHRLPLVVKRGYHMHFGAKGNTGLTRPVLDVEFGYLVAPMARGSASPPAPNSRVATIRPHRPISIGSSPTRGSFSPLGARRDPRPGSAGGLACRTCCRSSAPSPASPAYGSTLATTIWA